MSSAPVLVLDIDGVVSLAQPGSATPWYATLKQDLGLDYEEIEREFFRGEFMSVLQGRLDLYVALHNYLEPRGLVDRMEEFVAYWFEKDAVIDHAVLAQADDWRQRTGGRCFAASNQEHHRVAYLRDRAGLGPHFDEIVYSAELGVLQARPRLLHRGPGPHGRDGGAIDPVRRRPRSQCRRRAHVRLARHALPRAGKPQPGVGALGLTPRTCARWPTRSWAKTMPCRIIQIGTSTVGTNAHGRVCIAADPGES